MAQFTIRSLTKFIIENVDNDTSVKNRAAHIVDVELPQIIRDSEEEAIRTGKPTRYPYNTEVVKDCLYYLTDEVGIHPGIMRGEIASMLPVYIGMMQSGTISSEIRNDFIAEIVKEAPDLDTDGTISQRENVIEEIISSFFSWAEEAVKSGESDMDKVLYSFYDRFPFPKYSFMVGKYYAGVITRIYIIGIINVARRGDQLTYMQRQRLNYVLNDYLQKSIADVDADRSILDKLHDAYPQDKIDFAGKLRRLAVEVYDTMRGAPQRHGLIG